jgi:hypothetical protein
MTPSQTDEPTPQKTLRRWPGVVNHPVLVGDGVRVRRLTRRRG